MSSASQPSMGKPAKPELSRGDLIRVVKTPLGFFVLVVLVVEGVLLTLAFRTEGTDRTLAIAGSLVLLAILVAVVAFLAYYRAEALTGEGPEKIQIIAAQLERIRNDLRELDQMARFGSSGLLVAALLGLQDKVKMSAHCHAGGLTISPILLQNLPETASGFYDMLQGIKHELKLTEHHLVDNFLRNLVKALPRGSTWLGITRLQSPEAWHDKTANVAFYEFQRIVEQRTKNQELINYRLWSFDDKKHLLDVDIKEIMHGQRDNGLEIRFKTEPMEDISIIWIPTRETDKPVKIKQVDSPIEEIESKPDKFQRLCAITFKPPRGGRELEEMTIWSPKNDEFTRLCRYFDKNWKEAKVLPSETTEVSTE